MAIKFDEFIQIEEAAAMLGVNSQTLRSWERRGILTSYRSPINKWRLYKREELEKFLEDIQPKKAENGKE